MANILVELGSDRVIHITDGSIDLQADKTVTPETVYPMFNTSNAAVYEGVNPPTTDNGRYTYDPAAGVFTDTWPYAELSRVQFLDLLQGHGGVTDANLLAARDDATLAAFWLKFEVAHSIARNDAKTQAGLDALVTAGYLADKQPVLDAWPRRQP